MTVQEFYHNDPENWDSIAAANSVDPDQTALQEQSEQDLHCLPSLYHILFEFIYLFIISHFRTISATD